jgi:hypothetical protein
MKLGLLLQVNTYPNHRFSLLPGLISEGVISDPLQDNTVIEKDVSYG